MDEIATVNVVTLQKTKLKLGYPCKQSASI